jgi:hypothetical protein
MATSINYVPEAYLLGTERKAETGPSPAERKISQQIDTLQRMSRQERDSKWGPNFVSEMKDFYELNYYPSTAQPSYRPRIIIPEIQYLLMAESTDLTNDTPKVFISVNGKQDEKREKAFAAAWKAGLYNNRIFDAVFWSQFCNPSIVQFGYSPYTRDGKGSVWIRSRDPETFDCDPHSKNDRDWSYAIAEDYFYIDDIRRNWPEKGNQVRVGAGYDDYQEPETGASSFDLSMELPPGPLRVDAPQGFEHQRNGPRQRVRYLWVKDYAREVIREIAGERTALGFELAIKPFARYKYPGGRFITESCGITLADGPNFIPKLPEDDFGTFPFVALWSMPHLSSFYGPPPVRYGKGPQDIAERMYTQLVENMIRTNNAQTWIPEDSGIDIDAYGGIPGEVQVYRGEKAPTLTWPQAIPQHMTQVPEVLLQKVARYLGFTPERQGQTGEGNISTDIFDAALFQSQSLLRMKARFLAESYQRICQLAFHMMVRFKTIEDVLQPARGNRQASVWTPIPDSAEAFLEMDDTSVDSISSAMLKKLVVPLAKLGVIPPKFALETIGIPHADELAEAAEKQMALAALAKLKRPR